MSEDTILFLDFDGVLHPAGYRPQNHFCRLPLLADWLERQAPQVGVVISSDWRLGASLDALRMHFPQPLRPRILGALPEEAEVDPAPWAEWATRHPRQCLIMAWLAAQGASPQLRWAALDDWVEGFRPDERRLVRVDGASGLQAGHLTALSRILDV